MFLVVQGISSVITFFVLSGFLISLSIFDALKADRFAWKTYLANRFSRLYVVLIPALILGAIFDLLGSTLAGRNSIYNGITLGTNCVPASIVDHLTLGNFFGQLLFLQGIQCQTFGSNGVLWSLSCEFWYYIIFPCFVIGIYTAKKTSLIKRILLVAFGATLLYLIGPLMGFRFFLWLMGAVLVFLPMNSFLKNRSYGRILALVLAGVCFICRLALTPALPQENSRLVLEFLLGLSCMLCMYFILHDKTALATKNGGNFVSRLYEKSSEFFAGFSYSLYLVHTPFLIFLRALLIKGERWPFDLEHLLYGALIFAAVLVYAWLVAELTEKHTNKVRKWLLQSLKGEGQLGAKQSERPAEWEGA
jgi:peptidoglycan/LPS O-acetylase OafA/YrhL